MVGQVPPRRDQRFLQCVLGVLDGPEHPVAVHLELAAVTRDRGIEVVMVHIEETTTRV